MAAAQEIGFHRMNSNINTSYGCRVLACNKLIQPSSF